MRLGPYSFRRKDLQHAGGVLARHGVLSVLIGFVMVTALALQEGRLVWVACLAAPLLVIDAYSHRLPDCLTFPLLIGSLAHALSSDDVLLRLVGAAYLTAGLVFIAWLGHRVVGRRVLGGGDIKLLLCYPLLLGFLEATYAVLIACLLQGTWTVLSRTPAKHALPFGPALILVLVIGIGVVG